MKLKKILALLLALAMAAAAAVPAFAAQGAAAQGTATAAETAEQHRAEARLAHIRELHQLIVGNIPQSKRGGVFSDQDGVYVYVKDKAGRDNLWEFYKKQKAYQDVPLYTAQSPYTRSELGKVKKAAQKLLEEKLGDPEYTFRVDVNSRANKVVALVKTEDLKAAQSALKQYDKSHALELRHTATFSNPTLAPVEDNHDAIQARDRIIKEVAETERGPLYAVNENKLVINCKNGGVAALNKTLDYIKKHSSAEMTRLEYRECPYTLAQLRNIQGEIQQSGSIGKDELVIIAPEWARVEVYLTKGALKLESFMKQKQYGDAVTVFREINLR